MESPPRTPVQPTLTAFFPNAHSRSAPRMGKGGGASAAKKNALLSQQKVGADSEPNNNSSGSELQECITTPAKQASRASAAASAGRKRSMTTAKTTTAASKAKRTRTATTKRQTSVARSLSISFGPKAVSRLDFSAQSTTTTTTSSSSVQEIEQKEKEKEEGSTITATTKTLITEVSSSSSPSTAPAPSSAQQSTTSTLNIAAVKERLKSCKSLAQLKSNLSSFNNCAEQLKEFKSMKVRLLSPVKTAYVSPSKRSSSSFASPEKLSLSGLTMIPSPLKATAGGKVPAIPSKLTSSPFLASRRAAQEAVAQMVNKTFFRVCCFPVVFVYISTNTFFFSFLSRQSSPALGSSSRRRTPRRTGKTATTTAQCLPTLVFLTWPCQPPPPNHPHHHHHHHHLPSRSCRCPASSPTSSTSSRTWTSLSLGRRRR